MGDRANIVILQNGGKNGAIYLYTHWSGYELPATLADGLERGKSRWGDEPYLGRILFDALVGGDQGETGFGISTYLTDNSYPLLVVDDSARQVRAVPEGADITDPTAALATFTFDEFVDKQPGWDVLGLTFAP